MDIEKRPGDNTPYDDVFRTLITKGGNMVIPLINELFPDEPPVSLDAPVSSLSNELYEEEGNGKQKKIITGSHLRIAGKIYHLECQSQDDDSILIRMFQYDSGLALQEALREARYGHYHLIIRMPRSGVLFLRKTGQTPGSMRVTLETPGGNVDYEVPAARLADYSLADLMEKGLLFLLPFYFFNLEKSFSSVEKGTRSFDNAIGPDAVRLVEYLNGLYAEGKITLYWYDLLTDMLKKVTDHLTKKYSHLRKELDAVMGGKILEFRGEKEWNAGEEKGRLFTLVDMVQQGILTVSKAEEMAGKYGISRDELRDALDTSAAGEQMQG